MIGFLGVFAVAVVGVSKASKMSDVERIVLEKRYVGIFIFVPYFRESIFNIRLFYKVVNCLFGVSKSLILMPVSLSGTAAESCEIKTMTLYVEKFDFRDGVRKDYFMVIIC